MTGLILASGSKYRKKQLDQLAIEFSSLSPDIDESSKKDELPHELSLRLAVSKAEKIKSAHPDAVIIGSDQVCAYEGRVYGKPGGASECRKQLQAFSNNCVEFFTALCVIDAKGQQLLHTDLTVVNFRELSLQEINRYIELEKPLDCAGSFKVESLGLSLFELVESNDPSALMGLPLIKLCDFLRQFGFSVP